MKLLDAGYYIPASLVVVAAFFRQQRHPEHRLLFFLLFFDLLGEFARKAIKFFVLDHERLLMRAAGIDPVAVPFSGWVRGALHLHQAIMLAWGFALLAVMLYMLLAMRPTVILVSYLCVVGLLVAGYPYLRYERLAATLFSIHELRMLVGVMIFSRWLRREEQGHDRLEPFALALAFVAHSLTGVALFRLSFPLLGEPPAETWIVAQAESIGLQWALLVLYAFASISSSRSRSSSSKSSSLLKASKSILAGSARSVEETSD
jgi:hypothetical protein